MKRFICIVIMWLSCCGLFGDTAYPHFSEQELKLRNNLIKALKAGDLSLYENQLLNCPALSDALEICEVGLNERLEWDAQNLRYIKVKNGSASKYGIGKMVADFLRRTKTVVMFTKGFGSQSKTGGGEINGHWEEGEISLVGDKKEKYKIRQFNVVWVSEDLKRSPAAIALILAHEVGHGLAQEYRENFPLPYNDEELKKPPYSYFPIRMEDDDDMWCYPFEGMMAEELGITTMKEMHLYTGESVRIERSAKIWYEKIIGSMGIKFPRFYYRMRINSCLQRKLSYLAKNHRRGMRCKHFNEYQFCDNPVKVPPCHLWKTHLKSWYQLDPTPSE